MANDLELIVKESGLEQTKAEVIFSKFKNFFELAGEWEKKARQIVVTSEDQEFEIEQARAGRLLLRKKRIEIENARKELKEQALREGKAIDGIANVLKALIVPIEEHLERQEKFAEFKRIELEKIEAQRVEEEKRAAEIKRVAEEAAEQERIRRENERLRQEAAAREQQILAERHKQEAALAEERKAKERELAIVRAEAEKAAEIERKKQEAIRLEERKKQEAERRKQEEALAEERRKQDVERKKQEAALAKAKEAAEKAQAEAKALKELIQCPACGVKFKMKKGA
jgi:hypothetical protein